MTQPAKAQEPSMEEILASIRRIIADDDATKTQAQPEAAKASAPAPRPPTLPPRMAPPPSTPLRGAPQAAPPEAESESNYPQPDLGHAIEDGQSDVLDLTESMAAPVPPPQPAPIPAPNPAIAAAQSAAPGFRTIDAQPDVFFDDEPEVAPAHTPAPGVPQTGVAPAVERRDERDLLSSAASAAVDSAFSALASGVLTQNSRTIEDLVREMLRPMLKAWLDDNLPSMVERLVRAEIERVSRGRNS